MADLDIPSLSRDGGGGTVPVGGVRAPDYRQVQQPAEVDEFGIYRASREVEASAAARARELTDAFGEFDNAANKVGGILGKRAGEKAVAAGQNPQPMSGLAAMTSYGQGYDAAVGVSYETNSKVAIESHLADIESKLNGDPASYATQAAAVAKGALKEMPAPYAAEMQPWIQARIAAGMQRQKDQAAATARSQALADYQTATPRLITGAIHTAGALPTDQGNAVLQKLFADDSTRLAALVKSGVITPDQSAQLHAKMVEAAQSQASGMHVDRSLQPILSAMHGDITQADRLIVEPDPNLTPAENAVRLQEFEKERDEYVKAQSHAFAPQLADIHQQLAEGKSGQQLEEQLGSLYRSGALTEENYFAALSQSVHNQKKSIVADATAEHVDAIFRGEAQGPLDPANKVDVHAANVYWQKQIELSHATFGSNQYNTGAAEFARRTGIVPRDVSSGIRVGLLSGDPNRAASAAALGARIEAANPNVDPYNGSKRAAALARLINDNRSAGLDPGQAMALAVRTVDIPAEQREIREKAYRAVAAGNGQALQKYLDHQASNFLGFGHSPPVPVAMQAEYNTLTREYYDQTGNVDQARELAATQLHKSWGASKINGQPELMRWPIPDALVPTVRPDIEASAKAAGYTGDASNIHLTAIPQATDASQGRWWQLVDARTGDVLLDKNNQPLRYRLPSGPDLAAAIRKTAIQRLAQARAQRAQWLKEQADLANGPLGVDLGPELLSGEIK